MLAEDLDAFLFQHVLLKRLFKLLFADLEVLRQLSELLIVLAGSEVFVVGLLLHQREPVRLLLTLNLVGSFPELDGVRTVRRSVVYGIIYFWSEHALSILYLPVVLLGSQLSVLDTDLLTVDSNQVVLVSLACLQTAPFPEQIHSLFNRHDDFTLRHLAWLLILEALEDIPKSQGLHQVIKVVKLALL